MLLPAAASGPSSPSALKSSQIEQRTRPPLRLRPPGEARHFAVARFQHGQRESARRRVAGRKLRIRHENALQAFTRAKFVHAPVRAYRVVDAPGDGDRGRGLSRVPDGVAQHRHRHPRCFRVQRDERREGVECHAHRQAGIAERNPGQRILPRECGCSPAAPTPARCPARVRWPPDRAASAALPAHAPRTEQNRSAPKSTAARSWACVPCPPG